MDNKEYNQGHKDGKAATKVLSAADMSLKNIDYKCGFIIGFFGDGAHTVNAHTVTLIGELAGKYDIPYDYMVNTCLGEDYSEFILNFNMGYKYGSDDHDE